MRLHVCLQVVWHFRHDVVALLAGSSSSSGQVSDSGKTEGGFFSRKSKVGAPRAITLLRFALHSIYDSG